MLHLHFCTYLMTFYAVQAFFSRTFLMKRRISTSDIWADFCAALTSYDGGMTVEQLLNDGWQFCKLPLGSTLEDVSNAALQAVELPHDFLIENENDLYETTDAWYLRTLDVPESWCASCVLVLFDGVYMDCDVLLNGHIVCTHHYGYTAFDVDLTSRLLVGRNPLAVHIRRAGEMDDVSRGVLEYLLAERPAELTLLTEDGCTLVDMSSGK